MTDDAPAPGPELSFSPEAYWLPGRHSMLLIARLGALRVRCVVPPDALLALDGGPPPAGGKALAESRAERAVARHRAGLERAFAGLVAAGAFEPGGGEVVLAAGHPAPAAPTRRDS